jgi:hypothetical protein
MLIYTIKYNVCFMRCPLAKEMIEKLSKDKERKEKPRNRQDRARQIQLPNAIVTHSSSCARKSLCSQSIDKDLPASLFIVHVTGVLPAF